MPYRHLLFDLDNTLMDFDASSWLSWRGMMLAYGLPSDQEHYHLYKDINKHLWHQLEIGHLHQSQIKTQRWASYFDAIKVYRDPIKANADYFAGLAKHPVLIDGADSLIRRLSRSHDTAIVTNGIAEIQRQRLAHVGWDQLPITIIISDAIGVAKPDRRFFDHTFDKMSIKSPAETIIIGDTLKSDIRGGNNYNISTCWYNPHDRQHEPSDIPTYTIAALDQLEQVVDI